MSEIDWPTAWERTPHAERERATKFGASLAKSSMQIEKEMSRMDVDNFRASTASGGRYVKDNGLPKHNANPTTRASSCAGATAASSSRSPVTSTRSYVTTFAASTSGFTRPGCARSALSEPANPSSRRLAFRAVTRRMP